MSQPAYESATCQTSLVLLLRGLWNLDDPNALRKLIWRRFHTKLRIATEKDDEPGDFITVSFPDFFLQLDRFLFHILAVPEPFFNDREAIAAQMDELRLCQAVLEHEAYVCITLVNYPEEVDADEAARMLGKMTAALGGSAATLAVASPLLEQVRVWDRNISRALRSEHPLTALMETPPSKVPVVPGDAGDVDLLAATVEARRRWSQFANAFAEKHPDQIFAVKAAFQDGEFTEHMWIRVFKIEDEYLQGVLDNDPVHLRKYARGLRVRLRVKALSDWMYTDGERLVGGFTNQPLDKAREARLARSRAAATWTSTSPPISPVH